MLEELVPVCGSYYSLVLSGVHLTDIDSVLHSTTII